MRNLIVFVLFSLPTSIAFPQAKLIDSLKAVLQKEIQDTSRVLLLSRPSKLYRNEKPEIGLLYGQKGLDMARALNFRKGEAACLNALGHNYRLTGNYMLSLKLHFEALQIFEKLSDSLGIALSYHGISANYEDQEDYRESLVYAYKVKALAEAIQDKEELMLIQSNMGRSYEKLGQLDSALKYEQKAFELSLTSNDYIKGNIMGRLGDIHSKMGNTDLAFSFYRMGIPTAMAHADNNSLNELLFGIATLFEKHGRFDSSIHYAKKALAAGQEIGNPTNIVEASALLYAIYKKHNNRDSAFKYLEQSASTKDTMITQDKAKQGQALAFEENNRQKVLATAKAKAQEERKHNIQYAAIAIGLISFIVFFLLISNSIIINAKWIKFLGILALLIVFEFLNLIIHPYVEDWTNHSPVLMLLALASIAAILIPLHHRIEKWVTEKMVAKNKRIRLEVARKTIASLEGNTETKSN